MENAEDILIILIYEVFSTDTNKKKDYVHKFKRARECWSQFWMIQSIDCHPVMPASQQFKSW